MSTSPEFIQRVLEKFQPLDVIARPMFGEYGLYFEGKNFGLVGQNTLFIKVTDPGSLIAGRISKQAPYQGAKPAFKISSAKMNDREWLITLVQVTSQSLPAPKPKSIRPRNSKAAR